MSCFGLVTKGATFCSTQGQIYCNGVKGSPQDKNKGVEVVPGVFYTEIRVRKRLEGARGRIDV